MGKKRLDKRIVKQIINLRRSGHSLPEISQVLSTPRTTIFRYIQGVEIAPEYISQWAGKRGGSRKRKLKQEKEAFEEGVRLIQTLSPKEKLLFTCALYWAEGNKKELVFTNSDPDLIRVFISGLRELFGITEDRVRVSVRVYSDLDIEKSLLFWSNIVGVPKEKFLTTIVLEGKKNGKLQYGMCRIRILKGASLLKKIHGINRAFMQAFSKLDTIQTEPS